MRRNKFTFGCAVLVSVAAAVHAIDAVNGSTVTLLFTTSDAESGMQYPAGFDGVRWDDAAFERFELGMSPPAPEQLMAMNSSGELFIVVHATEGFGEAKYKGLVQWDGTDFTHLLQDPFDRTPATGITTGSRIRTVTVSPVTAGLLTAGHPVIVRDVFPDGGGTENDRTTELWSVDPSTSPATETLVHEMTGGFADHVVIDDDGNIYVFVDGHAVQELSFNGSGYDESTLITGLYPVGIVIGSDGALYALDGDTTWNLRKGNNDILRIDPVSGITSVHAQVSRRFFGIDAWVWDSAGAFWISLSGSVDLIIEVVAGETIGSKAGDRAAESLNNGVIRGLAAGLAGELIVAEYTSAPADLETEMYTLAPSAGGGDGGGGGGNGGGGRGKPK